MKDLGASTRLFTLLERLRNIKTTAAITITRRLPSVTDKRAVIVMDGGRAVEFDERFKLLWNPDGAFSQLVASMMPEAAKKLRELCQRAYDRRVAHGAGSRDAAAAIATTSTVTGDAARRSKSSRERRESQRSSVDGGDAIL
ncbi:hypothetical protein CXG81DRAFT_27082 [Caulochytrium protostelioides]|uniref:Uncharacterized protein n=1 Tax=Caulochytrium protostelioides TaxID=1555241 RepID=A0A4P9X502_9FUNG|nr:hypothetical protein CXG81DRAFT_27082 [Caulochytrium protostelioides]|eukprot:RKP00188.1 hypothetical protein CXG81DRAFT_27082 [Caulochytrium protostelioides]